MEINEMTVNVPVEKSDSRETWQDNRPQPTDWQPADLQPVEDWQPVAFQSVEESVQEGTSNPSTSPANMPENVLDYTKDYEKAAARGVILNIPASTAYNLKDSFDKQIKRRNLGAIDQDAQNINRMALNIKGLSNGWERERLMEELAGLRKTELDGTDFVPGSLESMRIGGIKIRLNQLGEEEADSKSAAWLLNQGTYSARQYGSLIAAIGKGVVKGGGVGAGIGLLFEGIGAVPGFFLGMTAGGISAAYKYSYDLESGMAYDEFKDLIDENGQKLPPSTARTGAMVVGQVNTVIEIGSDALLLKLIPGGKQLMGKITGANIAKKAIKNEIKAALASPTMRQAVLQAAEKLLAAPTIEATEEFLQSIASGRVRELTKEVSGQPFKYVPITEDIKPALEEAKAAFAGTALTLGAPIAGGHYYSQIKNIKRAEASKQFFEGIAESAANSKTREQLPDTYQGAMQRMLQNTPLDNIYIPIEHWNSYWKEKEIDPQMIADEVSGRVNDKYIKISTASYATKLAATEHNNYFVEKMKLSQDDLSAEEVKKITQQPKAEVKVPEAAPEEVTPEQAVTEFMAKAESGQEFTEEDLQAIADKVLAGTKVTKEEVSPSSPEAEPSPPPPPPLQTGVKLEDVHYAIAPELAETGITKETALWRGITLKGTQSYIGDMGTGTYLSFNREDAQGYAKEGHVIKKRANFENPISWHSPEMQNILKELNYPEDPRTVRPTREQADALRDKTIEAGYDAIYNLKTGEVVDFRPQGQFEYIEKGTYQGKKIPLAHNEGMIVALEGGKEAGMLQYRGDEIIKSEGTPEAITFLENEFKQKTEGKIEDKYRMKHRPMTIEQGAAPLYDLTQGFPDDIYSKNALQYYGTGEDILDKQTLVILKQIRNKPDAEIFIYRAIPKNVKGNINSGDWVSINKNYVIEHGKSQFDEGYRIIKKKVKARDVVASGDSIHEQGYYPEAEGKAEFQLEPTRTPIAKPKPPVQEDSLRNVPSAMPSTAIETKDIGDPMLEEITQREEAKRQTEIPIKPIIVKPAKASSKANPATDSLATYIRKQGGFNYQKERMKGELDRLSSKEAGTSGLLNKKGGGLTLDQMLEAAIEDDYFNENADINDLLSAIENEVYVKKKHYSTQKVWTDKELGKMMAEGMVLESKKDYGKILTENHKEYKDDGKNLAIAGKALKSTRQLELYGLPETQRDLLDKRGGEPVEKGGIKTHAIGITPELIRKSYINLQGQEVKTPKQVALLAQVFRNPQYETFRIIYVKDNKVVGHEGITSNLPGAISVFKAGAVLKEIHRFKDRFKRLGADGAWLVHNHPSGQAMPSPQDLNITAKFSAILPIKGHVVIDSGEYAFIPADGSEGRVHDLKTDDAMLKPSLSHELVGASANNQEKIAEIAAKIKTGEYITALYMSSDLKVRGIQEIPYGMLKNPKALTDYLRGRAREFGAQFVALAGKDLKGADHSKMEELVTNAHILDYVVMFDSGIQYSYRNTIPLRPAGGWMGSVVKKYNIAEEKGEYGKQEFRLEAEVEKPKKVSKEKEAIAGVVKQFKPEELTSPKMIIIQTMKALRDAYRAGNKEGIAQESEKLKRIINRGRKIKAIGDALGLTDTDMKKISRKNPLLMSPFEFKLYLESIEYKAVELAENKAAKIRIGYLIFAKNLKKTENYRRALDLPPVTKMTTEQANEFADLIEPFSDGDMFLTERELELVDRTDLEGIRTWREARVKIAKESGTSVEDLEKIKISGWDRFKGDTALMEKGPFFRMIVENTTKKLLEGDLRYMDIENKAFELARKSEKSRKRTLIERAIPQDKQIMAYLEAPLEDKQAIAQDMTLEQLDYAHYIQNYFQKALEYLIKTKALQKGRENYFVHIARSFLEDTKEAGLVHAFKNIFKHYQEAEAVFNILDEDTGNILPLEKFFQFALHRTGTIEPTANITKAFLAYAQILEKKISLDELMPKLDIYTQALTPQKYTPRGLELDRSLKKFVYSWINNKKGRHIDQMIGKQGGVIDVAIRGLKTFTTMMDLGGNIPVGLAQTVGERGANFVMLGAKKYATGSIRKRTQHGKAILKKYKAFTGRSVWENFAAPGREITEKLSDGLFALFHASAVQANGTFLLGSLTKAEFDKGEISAERLAKIKLEMGRLRFVPGAKSLVGSTAIGGAAMQYKTWAASIIRTMSKDVAIMAKDLKAKPMGEALTTREAREIYRAMGLITTVLIVGAIAGADEDDRSFTGELRRRFYREALSILQGIDPKLWLAVPRMAVWLAKLGENLHAIAILETYKTGEKKGKLKGVEGLKQQLTPRAIKQFEDKNKRRSK